MQDTDLEQARQRVRELERQHPDDPRSHQLRDELLRAARLELDQALARQR